MWRIDRCFLWPSSLELNGANSFSFYWMWGLFPSALRPGAGSWLQPCRDRWLDIRSTSLLEVCMVSGQMIVFKVLVQGTVCLFSDLRSFSLATEGALTGVLLKIYLYQWGHLVFKRLSSHLDHSSWGLATERDRHEYTQQPWDYTIVFSCAWVVSFRYKPFLDFQFWVIFSLQYLVPEIIFHIWNNWTLCMCLYHVSSSHVWNVQKDMYAWICEFWTLYYIWNCCPLLKAHVEMY